jgi:hypothetical protein
MNTFIRVNINLKSVRDFTKYKAQHLRTKQYIKNEKKNDKNRLKE